MIRKQNKRGAVLALYAIAMSMLVVCVGLSIDAGYLYTQKGAGQLTADITALAVLGSLDRTLTPSDQQQYVVDQVNNLERANGLPINFWTRYPTARPDGDIIRLKLNATNPLSTMVMNLVGISTVNVGIESIAVRGFIRHQIDPNCPTPGNLGLFGCIRLLVQGNPLIDSYNSAAGTYASQAIHPGCGSSTGGTGGHGSGGPGGGKYAGKNVLGASNRLVKLKGAFCFQGNTLSSLDTEIGGSGLLTGNATTEFFSGDAGQVAGSVITQSVPDINLVPAVGTATTATNDNATITGANMSRLGSPHFELRPASGSHEIQLTAGKKYYFKCISLAGGADIRVLGNPTTAGGVQITLEGPARINGDIKSDIQPMRPGWLKIIGINGTTECCVGCASSGTGHRGIHGHEDGDSDCPASEGHHHRDIHCGGSDGHHETLHGDGCHGGSHSECGSDAGCGGGDTGHGSHRCQVRPQNADEMLIGWNQTQSAGLSRLLGTLGRLDDDPTPAWMRPGALNLVHSGGDDDAHSDSHGSHSGDSDVDAGVSCCGTEKEIRFGGHSVVFADVYAPGYRVSTNGTDQFHGRIMAEDVQLRGTAGFHYDESLGGCISLTSDDTAQDGEKVHLVN